MRKILFFKKGGKFAWKKQEEEAEKKMQYFNFGPSFFNSFSIEQ